MEEPLEDALEAPPVEPVATRYPLLEAEAAGAETELERLTAVEEDLDATEVPAAEAEAVPADLETAERMEVDTGREACEGATRLAALATGLPVVPDAADAPPVLTTLPTPARGWALRAWELPLVASSP